MAVEVDDAGAHELARAREGALLQPWHLGLLALVLLALFVRWIPLAAAGFPPADGGMFAVMVEEVRAGGFALPEFTSYNGGVIPFAYPPLGFYLAALLTLLPTVDAYGALQLVPLVASTLTVVAVFPLAARLLRSRHAALVATAVFALLPRAFDWAIGGGGLTRAPGMLFAVAALVFVYDVYRRDDRRWAIVPAVLLLSAAVLSHMEMAWFAIFTTAILLASDRSRLRRNLALTLAGGLAVALLTAPWWALVLARHGLEPFLAAGQTGGWSPVQPVLALLVFQVTDAPLLDLFGVLAVVGIAWSIRQRQYLLPVWFLVIFVLDPRKSVTLASVPLSMLVAGAVLGVVVPALAAGAPARGGVAGALRLPPLRSLGGVALAAGAGIALFGAVASWSLRPGLEPSFMLPLAPGDVAAMRWVAEETPPDARFLVLSDADAWQTDWPAEWFPDVAGRVSLTTPQGTEWVPGGEFTRRARIYDDLRRCRAADAACLLEWEATHGEPFTHVYITSTTGQEAGGLADGGPDCCASLRASLAASPHFRLLYEDGRVQVFERTGLVSSTP